MIPYRHNEENGILAVGFSACDGATIVRESENPILGARFLWLKALSTETENLLDLLRVCSQALDNEKLGAVVKAIFGKRLSSEVVEACEEALGEEDFVKVAAVFGFIYNLRKERCDEHEMDR